MTESKNLPVPSSTGNRAMDAVSALNAGVSNIFSTITGETHADRLRTLEALTNAVPVADHLDETIALKDVIVQATTMVDEKTGEERDALRTILIDAEGTSYAAMSDGLFKALQNIFAIMGNPNSWDAPLPIVVTEIKGRKGYRFFTVKIA